MRHNNHISALINGGAILVIAAGILAAAAPKDGHSSDDACCAHEAQGRSANSMIAIPEPIRIEHDRLHEELARATSAGGETGEAAKAVRDALADHFHEENDLVMPLLGLLDSLADGESSPEMKPAIEMSRRVRHELPTFMAEHRAIHAAVDRLEKIAEREGDVEVADFARRLRHHAQHEEAVLYPAAILIGELVERRLSESSHAGQDRGR